MPEQLQISETIGSRTVDTEVVETVGIPSRMPPAERVVSVNARVEITDTSVGNNSVVFDGIIRSSIFYAPIEDPSNVVNLRRTFDFTERVSFTGARPGFDATIEALISDIDFYLIDERLIGVEFVVDSEIEVTAPDRIEFITQRPELDIRTQRVRIRREVTERNFVRTLTATERIPASSEDIQEIISADSSVQIVDTTTERNLVIIEGVVRTDLIYRDQSDQLEYVSIRFPFSEEFSVNGVVSGMSPFVDVNVISSEAEELDDRRIRVSVRTGFQILVITVEEVDIPTEVVGDVVYFPRRRIVFVERIVAEESTRILARDQISIPEGNPDVARIVRTTARVRGGSVSAETTAGGVIIEGVVVVNVIYVADLPQQPVYFTEGTIPFSYFMDIDQVTDNMDAFVDVEAIESSGRRVSDTEIQVSARLDVNLIVTERVRVSVITGFGEEPTVDEPVTAPEADDFITYTIRSGDTLYLIAQRYGVTVNQLAQLNNIQNPSNIEVGQQILIPR